MLMIYAGYYQLALKIFYKTETIENKKLLPTNVKHTLI